MWQSIKYFSLITIVSLICSCSKIEIINTPVSNEKIACFGDSLVQGVGAEKGKEYPALLADILGKSVDNFGQSGDTATTSLKRIDQVTDGQYGLVIVTLGGNEFMKREQWPDSEKSIRQVFQKLQASGAAVVFTSCVRHELYEPICEEEGVLFIPSILNGILHNDPLMADAVHPNSKGYKIMAQRVADKLHEHQLILP